MREASPEASCLNDPECHWVFTSQLCLPVEGCAVHLEKPSCAAAVECEWVVTPTVIGNKEKCIERGCAAIHSRDDCTANSTCDWFDFTDIPRCDDSCQQHDKQTCDSIFICDWDTSDEMCKPTDGCKLKNNEHTCNELEQCSWDSTVLECVSLIPCDPLPQQQCESATKCIWSQESSQCLNRHQCNFFLTEATCTQHPGAYTCEWISEENKCVPDTISQCTTFAKEQCDVSTVCEWLGSEETCRAECSENTCMNGHCNQGGCCICDPGFTGSSCDRCILKDANGQCAPTCSESLCSYHGVCNSHQACICHAGWTGAYCNVRACSLSSPNFVTTYPLRPLSGEPFTFIAHGCFDTLPNSTSRRVKVVPEESDCNEMVPSGCVVDGYEEGEATPMVINDAGGCAAAVNMNATAEPLSGMELLWNATITTLQDTARFRVCYLRSNSSGSTSWVPISSHESDGAFTDFIIIRKQPSEDTGSLRGAPHDGDEQCCEGLLLGELCLPVAIIILVWVMCCGSIGGLIYGMFHTSQKKEDLNAQDVQQKYDGFEMDDGSKTMLLTESNISASPSGQAASQSVVRRQESSNNNNVDV